MIRRCNVYNEFGGHHIDIGKDKIIKGTPVASEQLIT